jgi:hypothetical protein
MRITPRRASFSPRPVKRASGVWRHVDAGADFPQRSRLLVDMHVEVGTQQVQRSRHTADATAVDGD